LPLGRIDEALRQLRMAEELDPLSPAVHFLLRRAFMSAGGLIRQKPIAGKRRQTSNRRVDVWPTLC